MNILQLLRLVLGGGSGAEDGYGITGSYPCDYTNGASNETSLLAFHGGSP